MVVAVVVAVVMVSQFLQSDFLHLIFFSGDRFTRNKKRNNRVDPTVGIFQIIRDAAILRSFPPSIFFQQQASNNFLTPNPNTLFLSGRQPRDRQDSRRFGARFGQGLQASRY